VTKIDWKISISFPGHVQSLVVEVVESHRSLNQLQLGYLFPLISWEEVVRQAEDAILVASRQA
jgi:hypothetical protein